MTRPEVGVQPDREVEFYLHLERLNVTLSKPEFEMISREIAGGIHGVVGCSFTGFRVTLTVRSRSGKLNYEAGAEYDPESGQLTVWNPYQGGGATIIFRREFADRMRAL